MEGFAVFDLSKVVVYGAGLTISDLLFILFFAVEKARASFVVTVTGDRGLGAVIDSSSMSLSLATEVESSTNDGSVERIITSGSVMHAGGSSTSISLSDVPADTSTSTVV
ncbi:hypothetical protein BC943DRAFT_339893 [Umbelopsis sp. AD052]|nr:hypothetical protein BC943DRAFT_339893 [Umbelopsis sp. AD052]